MPKHFAITGATFTGNRGAEAMLLATMDRIKDTHPNARIHVLSYAPRADAEWLQAHPLPRVFLHSLTPAHILLNWLPLTLLHRLFRRKPRPLLEHHFQSIRRLLSVDAVLDLAGVSFIDSRRKFVPFNVLTLFPFLLHGVCVWKLSQAMGPFRTVLNRVAARWTLSRTQRIVGRGQSTMEHLESLGLPEERTFYAPDTAFTLATDTPPLPISERPYDVCIIPSGLMAKSHPHYESLLADTIDTLIRQGNSVNLVLHSWKLHTNLPRNNDLPLAQRLKQRLATPNRTEIIGAELDARAIKQAIAQHRICITSRFHGMIAALDTATPCLVLGWSHKYVEVLEDFGVADWSIDTQAINREDLSSRALQLLQNAEIASQKIKASLADIRRDAQRQYDALLTTLPPE